MKHTKPSIPFIILLTGLSVGGLISTDIFLPALGEMQTFYDVTEAQIQSVISLFLFGVAVSQLIYGPLSDSLGRKKVLIAGLVVWLISTVLVIYSTHINELLVLRLFQGIGSCAGLTIGKAIINDIMDAKSSAQLYLIIFPFVGMSPALAPMIGGILTQYFGWHSSFIFLTLFILVILALCFFVLHETLPIEKRQKLSLWQAFTNTIHVLRNETFLFYAVIPCFGYAAYFAYIVESPFMLTALGLSSSYIGYSYIFLSLGYVAGNIIAKKRAKQHGIVATIGFGYLIFALSGILFAIQMYFSPFALITTIVSISILAFGNGFLLALGASSAVASHPSAYGTASGVMGSLQLGSAALITFFIGKISSHAPQTTALIIACVCVIGYLIFVFGRKTLKQ